MEKIEPKIGEEIEIEGMKLICIRNEYCEKCALININCGNISCQRQLREDGKDVIFILKK